MLETWALFRPEGGSQHGVQTELDGRSGTSHGYMQVSGCLKNAGVTASAHGGKATLRGVHRGQ